MCVPACVRSQQLMMHGYNYVIYSYARYKPVLHSIVFTLAIHTIKMRLVYQLVEYLVLLLIVCLSMYMCMHLEL